MLIPGPSQFGGVAIARGLRRRGGGVGSRDELLRIAQQRSLDATRCRSPPAAIGVSLEQLQSARPGEARPIALRRISGVVERTYEGFSRRSANAPLCRPSRRGVASRRERLSACTVRETRSHRCSLCECPDMSATVFYLKDPIGHCVGTSFSSGPDDERLRWDEGRDRPDKNGLCEGS